MRESERRVAEALRAQAAGGRPSPSGQFSGPARRRGTGRRQVGLALLVALLAGAVLGMGLALVSVLLPGVLPVLY